MPLRRHPTCQETAAPGWPAPDEQRQVPAATTLLDHLRIVYLRGADLLPIRVGWLSGLFDPANEVEWFRVVLA